MEFWSTWVEYFSFDAARALQPDMWVRYGVQLLLLCGSSFFSGSETALFSLSHVDLQELNRERHRRAATIQSLLDEPRRLIVSILCGNELVNIAAVTNMTGILVALYGETKAGAIAVLVMLPLLLLVGEVTPKTLAVAHPKRISTAIVAGPLVVWVRLIAPIRWVIRQVSDRITTWLVGSHRASEHILQIDEFRSVIEDVAESGELNSTARLLINNLLAAGTVELVEIMTPRSRTFFLDVDLSATELINRFRDARHTRVPVYREHRDNLVGFLHAEDVVRLHLDQAPLESLAVEEVLRPPVIAPLTKKVDEMFDFFVKNNARAAVVLNEFGGVAGFITLNDVLRSIFGPLTGDVIAETGICEVAPNVYDVPGDMKLGDFNRVTHFGLDDPRMTTIGGVAFRLIDRLPRVGDRITAEDVTITVLEMDAHRVSRVRVERGAGSPMSAAEGSEDQLQGHETDEALSQDVSSTKDPSHLA